MKIKSHRTFWALDTPKSFLPTPALYESFSMAKKQAERLRTNFSIDYTISKVKVTKL